jgi:hypothetical protein
MDPRKKLWVTLAASFAIFALTPPDRVASQVLAAHDRTPADSLIAVLASAYSNMDYECYASLFADEASHGVGFRFVLFEPTATGETEWGYAEEMRLHRRMFRPAALQPGDGSVPPHLWVKSIDCTLVPTQAFVERFDLYRSELDPTAPLDRHRWRATGAVYSTAVVWHLASGEQFSIAGLARFVVIEDRTLPAGAQSKFLIYRWEDLGPGETGIAQATR